MSTPSHVPGAVPPAYGRGTLAEVLPAVAAHLLDDPARLDARDLLGLPHARRYVLCLVDGLGWDVLAASADVAPTLFPALSGAVELGAALPSTTAASITTLSTGAPPGRHGIVGFTFRWGAGRVLAPLSWRDGPRDPAKFQPVPPWWQRLAWEGVAVSAVGPAELIGTGLSVAALRGARHIPVEDETDVGLRVQQVCAAARAGSSALVYVYERSLDRAGHQAGWASPRWRQALAFVDRLVARLHAELGPDVCLLVTGDHGMVDVPPEHRLWCEDDPVMARGVDLVCGEARFRHVYTSEPEAVEAAWRARLGERAMVVSGRQAVEDGWFGEVAPVVRPRIGDVLAVAGSDWALLSRRLPREAELVGMHGGISHAETVVPLLVFPGQE